MSREDGSVNRADLDEARPPDNEARHFIGGVEIAGLSTVAGGGALATASATDTYSYAGTTETVVRIANSVAGVADSIVSPSGDRLRVKAGTTVNWFLPDLHGDVAGSLTADESALANAIRCRAGDRDGPRKSVASLRGLGRTGEAGDVAATSASLADNR